MKRLARLASIAVLGVALAVGAACTGNNNNAGDRVDKALKDANVKNVNVDFDRNSNVVHLKGKVDTSYDKDRADQIATSIVGTSGKVVNELTVEGMDEETADDMDGQIRTRLNDAVKADPDLTNDDVDFRVNNGVVTVTGEVNSAQDKAKVGEIVKGTTGVKDVANELTVVKRQDDRKPGRNRPNEPGPGR